MAPSLTLEQTLVSLRCQACGAQATWDAGEPRADSAVERQYCPELACFLTPGCTGTVAPEPLN